MGKRGFAFPLSSDLECASCLSHRQNEGDETAVKTNTRTKEGGTEEEREKRERERKVAGEEGKNGKEG